MKKVPDCRSCGACCICPQDQDEYCDLIESDLDALSPAFVKKHVRFSTPFQMFESTLRNREITATITTQWKTIRSGPLKSYEMNYCAALCGSVMHRVRCSIYENRPAVCRTAVVPGDAACLDTRRAFFHTIERLRERDERESKNRTSRRDRGTRQSAAKRPSPVRSTRRRRSGAEH